MADIFARIHNCPNLEEIKTFLGVSELHFEKFEHKDSSKDFSCISIDAGGKHVGVFIENGNIVKVKQYDLEDKK